MGAGGPCHEVTEYEARLAKSDVILMCGQSCCIV